MHRVKVRADYSENFIYKPGHIHSAPDAFLHIPDLNTISKTDVLMKNNAEPSKLV